MSNKTRNTVLEHNRLRPQEDGWNLAGLGGSNSSRTRNGGSGRPQLSRRLYHKESSSSDSDYEDDEESSDEESDIDGEEEEEENSKKPPPSRLFLEVDSLKSCMERNCRCPKCNGPVEMKVKTLCLASNVMVCCKDKDCGYVDVSALPATAEVGAKVNVDDRGRNILYVIGGFLSCGDGPTESARILGLLGLPNDTTMKSRSFGLIEERISPIIQAVTADILLENLTEEVRLTLTS
jgi:hypothetical protein